jgi:polyketide synthase 12
MAAIQLARHLGAEVFATASPAKWPALRSLGLDDAHIASSRDAAFEGQFRQATGGRGVGVVLNSLTGDLLEASLRLLPPGGRFIEMGKADTRDPGQVAAAHPGVTYQAFDLIEAGPARISEMLGELMRLLAAGTLAPLPVTTWEAGRAAEAFRYISQARHTGKVILRMPPRPGPAGTVLVTGGTGTLGAVVARHLAGRHQVRHLVLASRSGPAAAGAGALAARLAQAGAAVRVLAAGAADREQAAALVAAASADGPLAGVIHLAGVAEDATITALDAGKVERVLAPKAAGAWHLHEATAGAGLGMFVMFSSAAGVLGTPGQGNYAAANAVLDALAARRQAAGLPGLALAWGPIDLMGEGELTRMRRSGFPPLTSRQALELMDAGLAAAAPAVLAAHIDMTALAAQARSGILPPLLSGLLPAQPRRAVATLAGRLAGLDDTARREVLEQAVRAQAATVLGHATPDAIDPARAFTDLGFDSLTSVELRNRLAAATTLPLPATLVFDYPDPDTLTTHLHTQLLPADIDHGMNSDEDRIRKALVAVPLSRLRDAGLLDALLRLADLHDDALASGGDKKAEAIDTLDAESLVRMAFDSEGTTL